MMKEGMSLPQLAKQQGMALSPFRRYLSLINLSPEILSRALTGELPSNMTLQALIAAASDLDWGNQARFLGLDRLSQQKSS